jgi:hypothetical protein
VPDNQPTGNGQLRHARGAGRPGDDTNDAQWARLASFWALVLHRFRAYTQRGSVAVNRDCQQEGR